MKKLSILSIFCVVSLFAASNEEIINHFKSQINLDGLEYKIVDRKKIDGYNNYEMATVEISQTSNISNPHHNGGVQKIKIIINDDIIFPEAIDIKKNRSLLDNSTN